MLALATPPCNGAFALARMCILLSFASAPALSARASLKVEAAHVDAAKGPCGPSQLALTLWKVALQRNGAVHKAGKAAMEAMGVETKKKTRLHYNSARANVFVHGGMTESQRDRVQKYTLENYGVENHGKRTAYCDDDRVTGVDRGVNEDCWWLYFLETGGGKGGIVLTDGQLGVALDRRLWRTVSLEGWGHVELDTRVSTGLPYMKDMKDCEEDFDPSKKRVPRVYYNGEGLGLTTQGFCDNLYSFKVKCEQYKVPVGHGGLIRGKKGFEEFHEIWASCTAGAEEKCKLDKTAFCKTDDSYYAVEPDKTLWKDRHQELTGDSLFWAELKMAAGHSSRTLDDCADVYGTDAEGNPNDERGMCPETFSLSATRRHVNDCGTKASEDCHKFHQQIGEGKLGDTDEPDDVYDEYSFFAPCIPTAKGACKASKLCSCLV